MSYGSDTESKFIHNDSLIVVEFISIGFSSWWDETPRLKGETKPSGKDSKDASQTTHNLKAPLECNPPSPWDLSHRYVFFAAMGVQSTKADDTRGAHPRQAPETPTMKGIPL